MPKRILLVEPDSDLRHRQQITVSELGFDVAAVDGAEQAFEQIEAAEPDVILCDAFAPGTDDLDLVWQLARRAPAAALFVTSAPADLEAALEIAIRGAHDHLSKPLRASELRLRLRNARERIHLARQHRLLDAEFGKAVGERPIVAASSPMIRLLESVERAATDSRLVLLAGESGTGKEVIARAIHALSSRRQQSFVALQCAERPADAIRLELFGDPAARSRFGERSQRGLLREIGSGTLYLDEIGALPTPLQQELLALLREQQDEAASPKRPPRHDVRIIASSAQRLDEAVSRRQFSAELFEQLSALRLELPALRERREDIPLLVDHFIDHYRRKLAKPVRAIAEDALQLLVAYPWPGNIRELENAIEAAVMLASGTRIGTEDLPPRIALAPAADGTLRADLSLKRGRRNCEIDIIRRALRATGGNRTHAARRLEISHRALLYKIKEYGIDA